MEKTDHSIGLLRIEPQPITLEHLAEELAQSNGAKMGNRRIQLARKRTKAEEEFRGKVWMK